MNKIGYSPSQSVSDVDETDMSAFHHRHNSEVNELESAYKRRDAAKSRKAEATNTFGKRTIFFSCLLIVEWITYLIFI